MLRLAGCVGMLLLLIGVAADPVAAQPNATVVAMTASIEAPKPVLQTDKGWLLVDGKYVAPPYRITTNGSQIWLNDFAIPNPEPLPGNERRRRWQDSDDGGDEEVFDARPNRSIEARMHDYRDVLDSRSAIVLSEGEKPRPIYGVSNVYETFKYVLDGESELDSNSLVPSVVRYREALKQQEQFAVMARDFMTEYEAISRGNQQASARVVLLDQLAYPLSVLGMVLVVWSTGNLLSFRPPVGEEVKEVTPEAGPRTIKFVWMIVGFSILDLVWTIVASSNGTMRELNPIGAHLITNPMALAVFKLMTMSIAVGIFLYLRNLRRVELATWWMCLVLTLLTARWLSFNSLLV